MGISLTGRSSQKRAQKRAAKEQKLATERGIERITESGDVAIGFLDQAGGLYSQFTPELTQQLVDPSAQFNYLQNNPLFDLALQNANSQTMSNAAAAGRSTFGTTQQELAGNVLLSSLPLLQNQQNNIRFGLGAQTGILGAQADLERDISADISNLDLSGANAFGAGLIGAANTNAAGKMGMLNLGLTGAGMALGGLGGPMGALFGAQAGGSLTSPFQQNALLGIPGNTLGNTQSPGGFGAPMGSF